MAEQEEDLAGRQKEQEGKGRRRRSYGKGFGDEDIFRDEFEIDRPSFQDCQGKAKLIKLGGRGRVHLWRKMREKLNEAEM